MENKKKYVEKHYWIFTNKEMLAREKEKYIIGYLQTRRCWHGRRRSTLLDIYKQRDAGTGEGEVHYWIFTNKDMLAREKENNYFGTYEKANTHMEKQEEEAG